MNNEYIRTAPTKGEIALMQCGYFLSSDIEIEVDNGKTVHNCTYTKNASFKSQYVHSVTGESFIKTERIYDGNKIENEVFFDCVKGTIGITNKDRAQILWLTPEEAEAIQIRAEELEMKA